MHWRSPPQTDDEYIETIRKTVARFDGGSRWFIPLAVLIAVAPILLILMVVELIRGMLRFAAVGGGNPNAELTWACFAFAASLGFFAGHWVHSAISQLFLMFSGYRTERLVLRYHDAFQARLDAEPETQHGDDDADDYV
jgi:hypothetical protein